MIRRLLFWDAWSTGVARWVLSIATGATTGVAIVANLSPLMAALATLLVMTALAGETELAISRGHGTGGPRPGRPSEERLGAASPRLHRMAADLLAAAAVCAVMAGLSSFTLGEYGEGAGAFFGAVALISLSRWNRGQSQ